jgi:site-specific DNA recombinase
MLEDASKHQFDVVVVHTLDRWARNLRVSLKAVRILEQNNVGLVSITENLDWSTPEGRLTAHMLGGIAQFYSESLGKHVSKSLSQRAFEGKHTGGIPFGYDSCWIEENRERKRRGNPEHPDGIHPLPADVKLGEIPEPNVTLTCWSKSLKLSLVPYLLTQSIKNFLYF